MNTPLLQVEHLACSHPIERHFGFRKQRKIIFTDLSFTLEGNSTLGLLGPSGVGKSTLARCLSGIHKPDAGRIIFDGVNVFLDEENWERIRLEVQMLFQANSASLDPAMTIHDCVREGIDAREKNRAAGEKKNEVETLLRSVGLPPDVQSRYPSELSGGQRQRIALARTLAVQPKLLILDEPTSALDTITQQQILTLLKRLQTRFAFSLLLITHDRPMASAFCDRIAYLKDGNLLELEHEF